MEKDIHISKITIRDPKSTMTPAEYEIWKVGWDRLWNKLITEAMQQINADREKGIKFGPTPKREIVKHSFELAEQLNIELPKSLGRLLYDDVFSIKCQLEYELNLKNMEKDGCEVVFEPLRKPSSDIITEMIKKAKFRNFSSKNAAHLSRQEKKLMGKTKRPSLITTSSHLKSSTH